MKKIFWLFVMLLSVMFFNNKVLAYDEYKIGDKVTYNNEDYYVIEDSDSNTNYVTVLKADPLTADEVNKYNGGEYNSENGEIPYYLDCDSAHSSNCRYDYSESLVKIVVDNWASDKLNEKDLIEINGYKARLIKTDELINNLGYISVVDNYGYTSYTITEDTPGIIYNSEYSYWIEYLDGFYYIAVSTDGTLTWRGVYTNSSVIRPVINLNKCALGDSACLECENEFNKVTKNITRYNIYNIGDEIIYNGQKYNVIEYSGGNESNVILSLIENKAKSQPISSSIQYYTSDTCNSYYNTSGCTTDYDESDIKIIVDNWTNVSLDINDLVEVNGYKTRLITIEELINNLGYVSITSSYGTYYEITEDTPDWAYTYSYWTMSSSEDSNSYKFIVSKKIGINYVYNFSLIRPVINLLKEKIGSSVEYKIGDIVTYKDEEYYVIANSDETINYVTLLKKEPLTIEKMYNYQEVDKCAIDGGCWKVDIIKDECIENNFDLVNEIVNGDSTTVNVGNTLKIVSNVVFVISIVLIIGGIGILGYNYIKSKKELKK